MKDCFVDTHRLRERKLFVVCDYQEMATKCKLPAEPLKSVILLSAECQCGFLQRLLFRV